MRPSPEGADIMSRTIFMGELMTTNLLTDYASEQIAYRIAELRQRRIQEAELEDLSQDLCLALIVDGGEYDPGKGAVNTFINAVLDRRVGQYLVLRWQRNRKMSGTLDDLSESEAPTTNDPHQGALSDLDRLYLKCDVEVFSRRMTPRQKTICRLLGEGHGDARIGRNLKVHSKLVQQDMFEIREAFLDGGYWDHGPRRRANMECSESASA